MKVGLQKGGRGGASCVPSAPAGPQKMDCAELELGTRGGGSGTLPQDTEVFNKRRTLSNCSLVTLFACPLAHSPFRMRRANTINRMNKIDRINKIDSICLSLLNRTNGISRINRIDQQDQ